MAVEANPSAPPTEREDMVVRHRPEREVATVHCPIAGRCPELPWQVDGKSEDDDCCELDDDEEDHEGRP